MQVTRGFRKLLRFTRPFVKTLPGCMRFTEHVIIAAIADAEDRVVCDALDGLLLRACLGQGCSLEVGFVRDGACRKVQALAGCVDHRNE